MKLTKSDIKNGEIKLNAGGDYEIDAPIEISGTLTVTGSDTRPIIINEQADWAPAFRVGKQSKLVILNTMIGSLKPQGRDPGRAIHSDQLGGSVVLRGVTFMRGEGIHAWRGLIDWQYGGNSEKLYAYAAYLGNHRAGDEFVVSGRVENCQFFVSDRETSVRLMGFVGRIANCTFTANTAEGKAHKKESFQARHGMFRVENCTSDSWLIGPLEPKAENGDGFSSDYAMRRATYAHIVNHTQTGYLSIDGRSFVAIQGLKVTATDPRGVGDWNGPAIVEKRWDWKGQKHSGRVYIRDSAVDAFGAFADKDFIVGPGCTFKGKPVPVSAGWSQAEFDRIVHAVDEAIPDWADGPAIPPVEPEPEPPVVDPPVTEPPIIVPPTATEMKITIPKGVTRIVADIER